MNIFVSTVYRGLQFVKGGKIKDCFARAFDMLDIFRNYGKDNELQVQQRMLKQMLRYANKHCKYFRNIGKNLNDPLDIKQYPFMDKDTIRENFDAIASDNKDKMIWNIGRTGGSSGDPLEFLNGAPIDEFFQHQVWMHHDYEKGDKILSMMGIKMKEENVKKGIYWQDLPEFADSQGEYNISALYMNKNNIKIFADYIYNLKPTYFRGFPSFILEITKYFEENNYNIDFNVKRIELTSETSYEDQWKYLEKFYNTKVILQYGHTEQCVFAYSYDDTKKLRVEPLYGYVEILDENGNQVKEGKIGEVVVTSLHNYVMPFIRYKTGDYAEFGGWDGKYMILNRIIGRSYDYLINREGTKLSFTVLVAEHHTAAIGNVAKWQFEQFEQGKVKLRIVKAKKYTKENEEELISFFDEFAKVDVDIEYVEDIPKTNRGKNKLIIQHLYM